MQEVSTVIDLIRREFGVGVGVNPNPERTSATTAVNLLFRSNPRRLGIIVYNLTTSGLWVGPFLDLAATKGFRVAANGGSLQAIWREDYILPTLDWYCLSDAVDQAILSYELVMIG